jgi:hypothetical protein
MTAELTIKHQAQRLGRRASCTPRPVDQHSHPRDGLDRLDPPDE